MEDEVITQFDEEDLEQIKMLFKGICEVQDKIDSIKESEKNFTDSKKDMIKNLCEKLNISVKVFNNSFKQYLEKLHQKEVASAKESTLAFLLSYFPLPEDN